MSYRHLRNERGFFSDYYLGSVFGRESGRGRKKKLSDKETELAAARFRWLYERSAGKSLSAPDCRERFVRPLLREVFGFLLDEGEDRIYPLRPVVETSEEEISEPTAPVALAWIGGFDEEIDGRGKKSPRQQMETALSRQGLRYGFLVTGERLRLVRTAGEGPSGSYLEVDLAGLAEEPDPESFALILKLLSVSSFVPGTTGELPLEEYERESRKHAEKVSEDLKRAVFRSAESLVGGLIADAVERGAITDPATLPSKELHRFRDAALLAIYRLLFILYAEARDPRLDQHRLYRDSYSATGLVDEVLADLRRAWPKNRSSLWARCLALFEIYDHGLPPIDPWHNIPPRGGDFFDRDTPEGKLLSEANLSDAAIAHLMLDLATTAPRRGVGRERISFRELDIEDLGAVYEGLLEFEPRVATGPTIEIRVQGHLLALSPEEAARFCEIKKLSLRGGSVEWVAGTPAERFHPDAEVEDEEDPEEPIDDDNEEEDDDSSEAAGDSDLVLKIQKGGVARLERRLERGSFHFVPGPSRKGSGSFYTPLPLVQDLVRHALGPVAEGKRVVEIEALRVLDPACGSGHFLVEAMRYLGRELHRAYVREHGGKAPPAFQGTTPQGWDTECDASDAEARAALSEARAWCKRRIAERCLFGVDLNPMAVTLAQVALWIESAAGDRPLTYFKHHVRCGNSLLGSWLERLDAPPVSKSDSRQTDAFAEQLRKDFRASMVGLDEKLMEARRLRRLIDQASPEDLAREGIQPESPEEQKYKETLRLEAEKALSGAQLLFDLRSASLFIPEIWRDWRGLTHLVTNPEALAAAARNHSWWPGFKELRERYRFFHWELELPEVFLGSERRGFDAVLGNPPWDKVLPERHAFYARVDLLIRAFKGADLDERIRDLHVAHPGLKEQFEVFQQETKQIAQFLRSGGDFPHAKARSQAAHEDLSKYFLDRAARLAAVGGAVGFLVPSVIYNGDGCVGLRRYLLTETRIERFYSFENRRKLFPIDSRYKFINLVFRKGVPFEAFLAAFMRHDPEELTATGELPWLVRLTREEVERYSPETFAFLEYRSPRDQHIAAKMYAERPTLGIQNSSNKGSWGAFFFTDFSHLQILNATRDKDLWTDPTTGKPYSSESVLGAKQLSQAEELSAMRERGYWPIWEGKHADLLVLGIRPISWWLNVDRFAEKYGRKPPEKEFLAYRQTASNTNERTWIGVLLPACSAATNTFSGLSVSGLPASGALAVLSSLAFDYLLRLRTSSHVSFTNMRPMPVPPAEQAADLDGLSLQTTWNGGAKSVTDIPGCWPLLWKTNRAVAEIYGLNAADFEHILSTFPGMAKKRKAFVAYLKERLEEWKRES